MPIQILIAIGAFSIGVIVGALVFFCRRNHPDDDLPFDEIDFTLFGRNK